MSLIKKNLQIRGFKTIRIMSFLIIGASSGLGRELAFKFAQENNLIIVSRDKRFRCFKVRLELKFKVKVQCIALDFSSLEEINQNYQIRTVLKILMHFPIGLMFEIQMM